eukprot:1379488-Amphidinium_carterae.1
MVKCLQGAFTEHAKLKRLEVYKALAIWRSLQKKITAADLSVRHWNAHFRCSWGCCDIVLELPDRLVSDVSLDEQLAPNGVVVLEKLLNLLCACWFLLVITCAVDLSVALITDMLPAALYRCALARFSTDVPTEHSSTTEAQHGPELCSKTFPTLTWLSVEWLQMVLVALVVVVACWVCILFSNVHPSRLSCHDLVARLLKASCPLQGRRR